MSAPVDETIELLLSRIGADLATRADETLRPPDAPPIEDSLPHLTIGDGAPAEGRAPDLALRGVLGRGGMGVVYLARQASLNREVAIKRLHPGAAPRTGDALFREARFMGGLEHPNIVPVHALGRDDDGRPVLVMKRVEGVSWRLLVHDPQHAWWDAEATRDRLVRHVEILADVCRAVEFAHARGVVHRDLKPDNVMIGAFGEVYLMDWGVATLVGAREEALVGTPAYLAPEMLDPEQPITPAVDVYLLGACLHEVLTGRTRHQGQGLHGVLRAAHESAPHRFDPDVPEELAAICNRACAREPRDRYASVGDLRMALLAFLQHRGALALARAAAERAEHLRGLLTSGVPADEAGRVAVEAVFVEARFGFQQALDAHPENEVARAGLREVLERMARFHLAAEQPDAAAVLVDQLERAGGDGAALRDAVAAAREERERQRARLEALDVRRGATGRVRFAAGMAAIPVFVIAWLASTVDPAKFDAAAAVRLAMVLNLVIGVGVAVSWRWVNSSAVNRGLALSVVGATFVVLCNRLIGLRFGVPVPAILATDMLVLSLAAVGAGLASRPPFALAAVPFALGAAGIVAFPERPLIFFAAGGLSGMLTIAAVGWGTRPRA